MQTFQLLNILLNVVLSILVLSLVFPKMKQEYIKKKKLRETRRDKKRNIEKAQFVKTIRTEVRRYLEEIQND